MRPPLAQPITLDFDQVWLLKTARGRALLDVLSSGEISALLAGKVDSSDSRLSDSRSPTIHGASAHDATVEAVANKNQPSGYAGLDDSGLVPGAEIPYGSSALTACAGDDPRLDWNRILTDGASVLVGATGNILWGI